ncbi:acyltransferase [Massilia sp. IC2-476]|uniref:acyltransferase family protein n=1 Tax=Massilia sp. IC2-476 TaxID=2887199 RepID=UPI001D0F6294|nr:acyltransferase [Massilia sp. IC2-476]MCC2973882.1 acyltransferase [Massilia sp. IC2-476]
MTPITDTRPKLAWIQALRGIAVVLVVLTHARYFFLDTPSWELAEQWLRPGAMGVDLFFVISGFIMVYTTRHMAGTPADAVDFLVRRFARIWPLYALITVVWLTVNNLGPGWLRNPSQIKALMLSLSFQPVNLEKAPFFDPALPLGWTLNFEMYFYLVFGLCLLLGRWRLLMLAGWIVLTVILLPAVKRDLSFDILTNFHFSLGYLNLMTNPIILEFLAGVGIGWLFLQEWFRLRSQTVARHVVFLALCAAVWALWGGPANFHGPKQWGAVAALMVLALALASKTVTLVPPAVLVWLGTISFSLYLTHTTTQALVHHAVAAIGGEVHSWGHVLLSTAVAISAAAAVYHYLEVRLSNASTAALRALSLVMLKRIAAKT